MSTRLVHVAFLVHDYDPAIAWFTGALGFSLIEDTDLGSGKRWVRVQPPGGGVALLLARAADEEQRGAVGRQGGGRVAWFLQTDDFGRDHAAMQARGVRFLEAPRREKYGTVAVFEDLHGGRWDLIGPPGLGCRHGRVLEPRARHPQPRRCGGLRGLFPAAKARGTGARGGAPGLVAGRGGGDGGRA